MDKQTVINALALLGRKAEARGIAPEIAIYGGTVMMLAYRLREGTQDVDAVFRPRENLQPLIVEVAAELNLAPDWLNDNVSQFAPNAGPATNIAFEELVGLPGLRVSRPSARNESPGGATAATRPRRGLARPGVFNQTHRHEIHRANRRNFCTILRRFARRPPEARRGTCVGDRL